MSYQYLCSRNDVISRLSGGATEPSFWTIRAPQKGPENWCRAKIVEKCRKYPGSEVVPSRFAMCFVLQCFGPIQVPRWGPSRPVLVPSCSRAFLTGSDLDGQKQTSWPLPSNPKFRSVRCDVFTLFSNV